MLREQELLYGEQANSGLLRLLGRADGRVLDLGCGRGAMAPALRALGATTVVGVDPSEAAAAGAPHDVMTVSTVEDLELGQIGGEPFDVVVIADVLEHLVDPWAAPAKVRGWMAPGGRVAISTPNLGYFRVVADLMTRDAFTYSAGGGIMDATHLRWFTRSSMDDALTGACFVPEVHGGSWGPRRARLGQLSGGRLDRFLVHQIHVVGRAA